MKILAEYVERAMCVCVYVGIGVITHFEICMNSTELVTHAHPTEISEGIREGVWIFWPAQNEKE